MIDYESQLNEMKRQRELNDRAFKTVLRTYYLTDSKLEDDIKLTMVKLEKQRKIESLLPDRVEE